MKNRKRVNKGTVIIVAGMTVIVVVVGFMVYSFIQMRSYQKFLLSASYDFESPGIINKVKYEEQTVQLTELNLRALKFHLIEKEQPVSLFGVKKGECLEIQFIRGDGNISSMKLYETNREYLYMDYTSEQGKWKYYVGGSEFEEVKKLLSPEGVQEPNAVLTY